jgi:hypothetical protein
VNTAEVIVRLRDNPRHIRVLCPRGDFITDITLYVRDGQLTTRWGSSSGKELRRRASQGRPALYADVHVAGDKNTVLVCTRGKCRYRGYFNEQALALKLATEALAGHAEYQLTT